MTNEAQEQEGQIFSLPIFTYPFNPREKLKRKDVVANPNTYTMYTVRELLLHIEDYELVHKVCQVEADKKGIGDLYMGVQTGVPRYYNAKEPEEYAQFLARLEQLSLTYLARLDNSPSRTYSALLILLPTIMSILTIRSFFKKRCIHNLFSCLPWLWVRSVRKRPIMRRRC